MALELFRIDERLLHGQVTVGWGMRLHLDYYVIVDDDLATSDWEQELYAAGLPGETKAIFVSVDDAVSRFLELDSLEGRGALLTRGTAEMRSLAEEDLLMGRRVNVGGIHAGDGRRRAARYVFLRADEVDDLRAIGDRVRTVSARDLPTAREIALTELLHAVE